MAENKKVKIQLVRSLIGTRESHRATVRGLGLGRVNSVSELEDTPAVRGMMNKVSYLIKELHKVSDQEIEDKMELNNLKPSPGSKHAKRRVGRGIGSGLGKTAGRGHKGQKSRSGGFHKVGFEGGQMPLYRRLPKRGFVSLTRRHVGEITLADLQRLDQSEIDLVVLKQNGLANEQIKSVKVIKTGELTRAVTLKGLTATAGARAAIEAAGGKIVEEV